MGGCLSAAAGSAKQGILGDKLSDGDDSAYHDRYVEDNAVLGEGEFAKVTRVFDVQDKSRQPLACKVLKKGVQFKDNVLYSPLKPEVLRGEVDILKTLAGNNYCLKLFGAYEGHRNIRIITELCDGGEMMEYLASLEDDLTARDVSRIAYQLLSAVDHCEKRRVLHRDIKPGMNRVINRNKARQRTICAVVFPLCSPLPSSSHTHTAVSNSIFPQRARARGPRHFILFFQFRVQRTSCS